MSKRKINKRKSDIRKRRQMLKIAAAVFILIVAVLMLPMCQDNTENNGSDKVVGVWISYGDFKTLGLYNRTEDDFEKNANVFLDLVEEYGINTIYFHVRAFRDAAYKSEYFPMASYVWDRDDEIEYDPLQIMIDLTHEHGMKLHAWMNPYRNTSFAEKILDPAAEKTCDEILLSVDEVLKNYDVDGIHFDDYFYEEGNLLSETEKKQNVNKIIRKVYKKVHNYGRDLVFGISPAGNTSYCASIGADVETWLAEEGYVDYIIPQIYWTDEHTAAWRSDMFTDTLDEWIELNENGTDLYVGLAAYKAGIGEESDPGWKSSSHNLADQVKQIHEKNCEGYVFFSAGDFYRDSAADELVNYRNLVF